jgi:hypothetical protein
MSNEEISSDFFVVQNLIGKIKKGISKVVFA